MDEDERRAIRDVLKALLLEGEQWIREQPSAGAPRSNSRFTGLKQRQLDSYLHRRHGAFGPGEVIRVKPPPREAHMAALWCKWRFDGTRVGCWFYLGIWLDGGQFIAFRFEPPEQGDNHDYYHCQPCRTMGWKGAPEYNALPVPERNPTWPLAASSSLDLLLCLVVSIQGMIGLRTLKQRIDKQGMPRRNKRLTAAFERMIGHSKKAHAS